MNSDWNANRPRKKQHLSASFRFAWQGIRYAVKSERNLQIHLLISAAVLCAGAVLKLSITEWFVVLLIIGVMVSLELLNTALEKVVDLVTEEYHPLAKQAKDLAAGSVLVFSIISVLIGLLIFVPKAAELFRS
ncbi:diacylglycerol kinase family protein [Mesobacillus harenae]|uniref:diacylglycerol kinase family protein n=1 Tax=Mesobacillus harenae TaxID=2213203 RepID=UPI0015810308|nr:diacylglycerol kinase family protein [Mesobacillus harenae]